nr:DNA packaging tegument protein UL25 [Gallid alphaherpesvirus 1]
MFRPRFEPMNLPKNSNKPSTLMVLADRLNFISCAEGSSKYASKLFEGTLIDAEIMTNRARIEDLERRNRAAKAALEQLENMSATVPVHVSSALQTIEYPLETVIDVLDDLAQRAVQEKDIVGSYKTLDIRAPGEDVPANVIWIVKNGEPLTFNTDFQVDFLTTSFAIAGNGRLGFGSWFRALQTQLLDNNKAIARVLNVMGDTRISGRFMKTAIRALRSAMEIYAGTRQYSGFEATVLCLLHYSRSRQSASNIRHGLDVSIFEDALRHVPTYLNYMLEDIRAEWGSVTFSFDRSKLPVNFFSPIDGRKYSNGVFDPHIVYQLLKRTGTLSTTVRDITKETLLPIDPDFVRFDDPIAALSISFFPSRRTPLILHEDDPLVRTVIDSISLLLVLQKLMFNSNVYTSTHLNRFQPSAFFELPLGTQSEQEAAKWPVAPGSRPQATASTFDDNGQDMASRDNNLFFLFEKYVVPMYRYDNRCEVTGFFPGLAALCITGRVKGIPTAVRLGEYYSSLCNLIELDLRKTSHVGSGAAAVLAVHDSLTGDVEEGVSRLLEVFDAKKHLKGILRTFNVESDSDLIYFMCLGCLPHHVTYG